MRIDGDVIEMAVWDTNPVLPVLPVLPVAWAVAPGRPGQHGQEIVVAVTHGFAARREAVGKRITARIPLTDEARRRLAEGRP
ncbi:hypothetical protein [Streptomyces sp. NPDC001089]